MCLGSGANGKSVLLNAIEAALGRDNVSTLSLHRIESDRFAVSRLVGKLANINRDLPATDLRGTAVFKQLVGGDSLTGERKFRECFDFRPVARLIFSANHAPRSPDASEAFFRRWIVCPFPNTFEGKNAVSSRELHARLTARSELAGLLNRALRILPKLRREGFTVSPTMQSAAEEFRALADPVAVFLDTHTVQSASAHVTKRALFDCYSVAATKSGWAGIPMAAFGRALKKLRPAVGEAQLTVGNIAKTWCWTGIGLKHQSSGAVNVDELSCRG
jgi:putative DNA primase/helicase